ncbi:MAG: hypothetical protein AAB865_01230 [Patescibacteria group bacterium]
MVKNLDIAGAMKRGLDRAAIDKEVAGLKVHVVKKTLEQLRSEQPKAAEARLAIRAEWERDLSRMSPDEQVKEISEILKDMNEELTRYEDPNQKQELKKMISEFEGRLDELTTPQETEYRKHA